MTRTARIVGLTLALATAGLCGCALPLTDGTGAAAQTAGDTPLPPGWELCVLQGVSAPVTAENVVDLDQWQAAEGGSTNNTAAYNPFNTRRMTDASGAPIPGVLSANGFPAFANWAAGCTATVTTLFQPNMWPITSALRAGTVAPAGAFLAVVDQSAWCAPSADGVPCYADAVLGVAGTLPDVARSSALDVYGNVRSDLHAYQQAVAAVVADQGMMAARNQQLAAVESQVSAAQTQADAASRALRQFAIAEYVSSGLYSSASLANLGQAVNPHSPPDADGVVARQYLSITATDLIGREKVAVAAVTTLRSRRADAARAVSQAAFMLTSDNDAERRSLAKMVVDVATMQTAGACTTVAITAATPTATAPTGSATTTTTVPSTTTTTTVPAATPTTAPTVPTTLPPTTTTTTTLPGTTGTTIPLIVVPTTTVPSTTLPPSTTTTTVPGTTTTSTTVPGAPSTASPQNANPAGVAALQGCVASLAPTAAP